MTEITSTTSITIREFRNARPIFAVVKAFTKLSKLKKFSGKVMTFVLLYSSSVFNAVIKQETRGSTQANPNSSSVAYLIMFNKMAKKKVFVFLIAVSITL
jgi:hypothetical protein